jgi:succinyl-diaminopimelate desuccinylase
MGVAEDVGREIGARRDELIDLCARCVRIPGVTPPGDTTAIAAFARAHLEAQGIATEVFEPRPGSPSVVATVGRDGASPNLVVNGHLDTFPPADGDWAHGDPFSGAVDDGRLYGCGASDMRGSLGATLFAAGLLHRHDRDGRFAGRVTLVLSADEEAGGRWGTAWLLANVERVRGDACLVGDQCGTDVVGVGEKGMCFLTARTTGSRSHAAYGNDESAVHRLLHALRALRTLEALRPEQGEAEPGVGGRVTVNVGRVEGGTSPNLVADRAEAQLDVRLPVWLSSARLMEEIDDLLEATGTGCEVVVDLLSEPSLTPVDDPLVASLLDATRRVSGSTARPITRVGASDARLFRAAGIPTAVYGPAPNRMGAVDEFVVCDELVTTARVHAAVMLDHLLAPPGGADRAR